jgi:NADPH:quinone reductase-like Zn-dependent oxidoreductase
MIAVTTGLDGLDAVSTQELPDPEPGPGEVLVATEAATVNPADVSLVSGTFPAQTTDEAPRPVVPGWDLAGLVVAAGEGVDPTLVGRRVLGFLHWFVSRRGTQQSSVVLPAEQVAAIEGPLSSGEVSALGLNGLTSIQLVRSTGLAAGQSVLVTGAAGSTGALAVQLAARAGLVVVAYAGERDRDAVLALGATHFVSRDEDLAAAVRAVAPGGVDAVANTVPGVAVGLEALRDGGSYRSITVVPDEERGVSVKRVGVRANADDLAELVRLGESGDLRVQVAVAFPAEQARQAYAEAATPGRRGPVVLTF